MASQYEDTQANLKLTLQRNLFGLHAPIRTLMEREIVSSVPLVPRITANGVNDRARRPRPSLVSDGLQICTWTS